MKLNEIKEGMKLKTKFGDSVSVLPWTGIDFEAMHSRYGLIALDKNFLDKEGVRRA